MQPTTLGVDSFENLVHALSDAMASMQALHQQAVETLAPAVQQMVRSGSQDAQWIEHTLDQLLSHAGTPEGLGLFKTLCRHYWTLNPQATASYINAYREMWDGEEQNDAEEVVP
jgi:hypothetical protein